MNIVGLMRGEARDIKKYNNGENFYVKRTNVRGKL